MTIVSMQKIREGEPITDNYGPLFTKMCRKERLYKLEGRYWFKCSCSACVEDWPTYENMPAEVSPKNEEERDALQKLQKLDDMFYEDGLKAMEKGHVKDAIERFSKYLNEFESFKNSVASVGPYRTFHLVQDALKLCLPSNEIGRAHV